MPTNNETRYEPSSFRDPSGFLFYRNGTLYRQINKEYREHYEHFKRSGLYEKLLTEKLIVPHHKTDAPPAYPEKAHTTLTPEPLDFISYPYEWCFSQLKDAALLTLKIQQHALEHGMTLKDASSYNIQFHHGKPVFIDLLSFEKHEAGKPWIAYRQFCQHFIAPLVLMSYRDARLNSLSRNFIDGIPLDLASQLLPKRTKLHPGILFHIHLHAQSQKYASNASSSKHTAQRFSEGAMQQLISSLAKLTKKLTWGGKTEWGSYYQHNSYTDENFEQKKNVVADFIKTAQPQSVWDIGGNTGEFAKIASNQNISSISFDIDHGAVEAGYLLEKKEGPDPYLFHLLIDITNPSPGIGWNNAERAGFLTRSRCDMIFSLALVHHLAISNNTPFDKIADLFSHLTNRWLVIEFVPKDDSMVQKLLSTRVDIFPNYNEDHFEKIFSQYFSVASSVRLENSTRTLYLMKKKGLL